MSVSNFIEAFKEATTPIPDAQENCRIWFNRATIILEPHNNLDNAIFLEDILQRVGKRADTITFITNLADEHQVSITTVALISGEALFANEALAGQYERLGFKRGGYTPKDEKNEIPALPILTYTPKPKAL